MKGTEIKPDIYWVGAIDWAVRDFHGYMIPNGTTYNNYLILDEDVTLVDTVKREFGEVSFRTVKDLVDPSRIRNLVVNHVESDHAGSLGYFMQHMPGVSIYITEKGRQVIERFFDISGWDIHVVQTGDTLNCGRYTLEFIETPMIHWPDSMMTFVHGAGLLISQDSFGQHLATASRFDDEFAVCASQADLDHAVVDYYANILMPFGKIIKGKIKAIEDMGVPIEMIAPDHGVIWRQDPGWVIQRYKDMIAGQAQLGVTIIYDTMWKSTEIMTRPLMEGVRDEGVDCKVIKLRATSISSAVTDYWRMRGCLIGSPTLNNGTFPSISEFLTYLQGLRPNNRIMGAFGSYGWSGGAVKKIMAKLTDMKLEMVEGGPEVKYRPTAEEIEQCYQFGREFARRTREYHETFAASGVREA